MENATITVPGIKVSLKNIESELINFWKGIVADSDPQTLVKTSTMNFIIISQDVENFQSLTTLIQHITKHHPGRILLVLIDKNNNTDQIDASITAYCQSFDSSDQQLCCEQITLSTGRDGMAHLNGVIIPLLLPDLPVFLWHVEAEQLRDNYYGPIYPFVNRIILDLGQVKELSDIKSWINNLSEKAHISDLAWTQITPWREALALPFDNDLFVKYLMSVRNVKITSRSDKKDQFPSWLLVGWLMSQLNWSYKDYNGNFKFSDASHQPVDVEFCSDKNSGGITKIELSSQTDDELINFSFIRSNENEIEIKIHKGHDPLFSGMVPYKKLSKSLLICNELDFLNTDRIYLKSLGLLNYLEMNTNE